MPVTYRIKGNYCDFEGDIEAFRRRYFRDASEATLIDWCHTNGFTIEIRPEKRKVPLTHSARSSFFWRSKLSLEEMDEIIAWLQSLDDKHRLMVKAIIDDVIDHERYAQEC